MFPQNKKKIYQCRICAKDSHFLFYGAQACEGCKQFFRRVVLKRQKYTCHKDQKCDLIAGDRCRGCRLLRCLQSGMDAEKVQLKEEECARTKEFKQKLMDFWSKEQQKGQGVETMPVAMAICTDQFGAAQQMLAAIAPLEQAYRRCWLSMRTLPEAYTERHPNIQSLLGDKCSLWDMAGFYMAEEPIWDKAQFLEQIETEGLFSTVYMKTISKDFFLGIETAKAMPHFGRLNANDQVALLKRILTTISCLCGGFFSVSRGAETQTRGNGMTPNSILTTKRFQQDHRLRSIYQQANSETIKCIREAALGYEEYVLLLAILFSNSTAEDLSREGRELLYAESVRYSKALQKLLANKFGHISGAQKFAEAMRILEVAFRCSSLLQAFILNVDLFYEQKHFVHLHPKALSFYM